MRSTHTTSSHRRFVVAGAAAVCAALAAATVPAEAASAADVIRFSYTEPATTEVLEPCGAEFTYTTEVSGVLVLSGDGELVRQVEQDTFPGTITYQGTTYTATDRQVNIFYINRDDIPTGVLNGQGLFTRLPGIGVAFYDVGHLVFNEETGETLMKSNKVVGFDEPFDFGAEVCAALTG